MNSPRASISVIITCYNYEQFVGAAIDSVLNQTRLADEIIVVDDGSTDGSREVISHYGDRVRPVFQKNEGIKAVSNRGYAESRCDIVLYLDADDRLYPKALAAVEQAYRPGVAKIQFELDIIDQDGVLAGRRYCNFPRALSSDDTARTFARTGTYLWPVTSGNAYARTFLEQVMPLTPPVSHDGVLNTIAPVYGEICTITEPMGQYRVHSRNISRVDDDGQVNVVPDFASRIRIRKEEFELLRRHAALQGKTLPAGDFLDNELVFLNYRMMARKLGREDGDDSKRSLWNLWLTALLLVLRDTNLVPTGLKHIVWLTSLFIAPPALAKKMIEIRYNRTHWRANLRRQFSGKRQR